jgi:hypothetical protein
MSGIVDFAQFLSGKYGIKTDKRGITANPKGITADNRGINADNFYGKSMNSSLKWLKIRRNWAILGYFDADSGVFWEEGGVCAESSVADIGAFWVNILLSMCSLLGSGTEGCRCVKVQKRVG